MREFEKSVLYILKISNKRFINIIKSILFIKRLMSWEVDIYKDEKNYNIIIKYFK